MTEFLRNHIIVNSVKHFSISHQLFECAAWFRDYERTNFGTGQIGLFRISPDEFTHSDYKWILEILETSYQSNQFDILKDILSKVCKSAIREGKIDSIL